MSDTRFHRLVLAKVAEIKEALRDDPSIHRIVLHVEVEGRLDGELEVRYGIGEYVPEVVADSFESAVQEYLRRRGWKARHKPLCLPNVQPDDPSELLDDEVPF